MNRRQLLTGCLGAAVAPWLPLPDRYLPLSRDGADSIISPGLLTREVLENVSRQAKFITSLNRQFDKRFIERGPG